MFSIIIPTFNNLEYLKLCLESIKKNSKFNHQIIIHINVGNDGTKEYLKSKNIEFTFTEYNSGICEGMNKASIKAKFEYILYAHDDFYFCPEWDKFMYEEIKKIGHNRFYLSGIMMNNGPIKFDCGNNIMDFDEQKLLNNFKNTKHYDFQGSTWAPHLIHKKLWNEVGGFSEEYYPGTGSDPDLNMKLWKSGVRIFKGINLFRIYHFSSVTTRKKLDIIRNKGDITFLKKWGFSTKFFKKHYLKSKSLFTGPLDMPKKNLIYYFDLFLCKIKKFYFKLFYNDSH